MKKYLVLFAVCLSLGLSSCSSVRPVAATSNPVGNKCGTTSQIKLFHVFGIGGDNMGINKAAKKAGISKISHIDYKSTNYILWTRNVIYVYGE